MVSGLLLRVIRDTIGQSRREAEREYGSLRMLISMVRLENSAEGTHGSTLGRKISDSQQQLLLY
jgi:hypothetical protein